ncbi:MAG TPA: two-component regulator propeller domain-containing protein [Candidatus Limnocylindrales bacterium]|nr:two-component regulator propeller domain-containing protein [Candidatus Limnocylindrales bacterium]
MGQLRSVALNIALLSLCVQGAALRSLPEGYTRRVWQTQDGLPENTAQSFAQTPDQYLWIGTSGGLVRFDGAGFVVFDRDNTPAIRDNSIFCLTVSRDGSLWAGTDGAGLVRYKNGQFRAYGAAQGLTNDFVRAVFETRDGVLWAGTDDGLFQLNGDRLVRVDGTGKIPSIAVHAIREDSAGNVWVGGSILISIRGDAFREYHLDGFGSATRVKSIAETADGAIWVGTVSGLQRMARGSRDSGRFERVPEIASTVRALRVDHEGVLWIGTIGDGLLRYSGGKFVHITAPDNPPSGTVLAIFDDSEQNIWAGMQTGLMRLSRAAMSTFPLPDTANADFGTVYADPDGSLWVAGTHLFHIDAKRERSDLTPSPSPGVRVRSVFRDRGGALWIGTEGNGVFRVQNGRQTQYTKRTGLVNDFVRAFLEARDGSMWIGTDEGITHWREGTLTNYLPAQGLAYFSVRTIAEDRAGGIWIGTERGASHWMNGRFVQDAVTERLRREKVWAIHEDTDGGLWFGTRGAGLFRWRNGKLTEFGAPEGLAAASIYQILEDERGVFWMSGPNAILAVSRHDLDRLAGHPGFHPAVTLYGLSDGVEATQIYGGVAPAGCVTANGEIWFPSNRGPVRIAPGETRAESLPKVTIEQALLDGRVTPVTGPIVAPPGEGKLQIAYAAIHLRSQERIRFRYMLENFDHDWTEAGRRREAFYNLGPGKYRFRVQAFEMNTPESVSEASLEIEWLPHFYRTAWFLWACAGSIIAAALLAYRMRLRQVHSRFRAVLEERNRVAREMHDTVIQGCAGVSALLEAISIGTEESGSRRELLDCARTQVRATVDEARRAVWNLRQNGGPMPEIGSLLDQMAQQASSASHVPVRFEASGKPVLLDPAVEHDILMVAREAVYNAVQHARPTEVKVQVRFEHNRLRLRVADDGCGFHPEKKLHLNGEHFGLVGMRERTARLGGNFDIRSAPGTGTELLVEVPVRSAAAEKLGIDLEA